MNYLVANWKSHKNINEVKSFFDSFRNYTHDEKLPIQVIICPPFPFLYQTHQLIEDNNLPFSVGTQDLSPFPLGAYTGAIASAMIAEWTKYTILGHSERRRYFHETSQEIANKVTQSLEHQLTPILCVDEPYAQEQIELISKDNLKKCLIAYEPLEAIGSGQPDTPVHAQAVARQIIDWAQVDIPILYGGSVTPDNIQEYLTMESISGALVGGASL